MAGEFTEDDLVAVRRAMVRGVRTVQYRDRSTTYSSMEELAQVERRILEALDTGRIRRKQQLGVSHTKGF